MKLFALEIKYTVNFLWKQMTPKNEWFCSREKSSTKSMKKYF